MQNRTFRGIDPNPVRTRIRNRVAAVFCAAAILATAAASAQTTSFLELRNNAVSTLAAPLTDVGLTLTVQEADADRFPEGRFRLVVGGAEIVEVSSRTGDVLALSKRGAEDTTAQAHPEGASVRLAPTAGTLEEIEAAIHALELATVEVSDTPEENGTDAISTGWAYLHTEDGTGHLPAGDSAGDLLATAGEGAVEWKSPAKVSILLQAQSGKPTLTDGCDAAEISEASAEERVVLVALPFTNGTYAQWDFVLPRNYVAGSPIDVTFYWTSEDTGTNEWVITGRAYAPGDSYGLDMDANPATTGAVTQEEGGVHLASATTDPLTLNCTGTPSPNMPVILRVSKESGTVTTAKLRYVLLDIPVKAYE